MNDDIIVTILVENTVHGRGLMAEHGLAFHVQAGTESLLFDTGQSALLAQNARHLAVDLTQLRAVALSHGHYDHIGGLSAVWELAPNAALLAHPTVLATRFTRNADAPRALSGSAYRVVKSCKPMPRALNSPRRQPK